MTLNNDNISSWCNSHWPSVKPKNILQKELNQFSVKLNLSHCLLEKKKVGTLLQLKSLVVKVFFIIHLEILTEKSIFCLNIFLAF